MDTYFRGNSQELEFCRQIRAGGNHVVAGTASGHRLGVDRNLRLRDRELSAVLEEYRKLPAADRKPKLEDPKKATPPRRPVPQPPPGGLIVRGYCTYMHRDKDDKIVRSKEFYYKQNPDRWAAETQSDILWLTADEWKSLVPANPKRGEAAEVAAEVQRRFFSTIAIDYMEGSVNSLVPRRTSMTLTVQRVTADGIDLRLDGYGHLGKALDDKSRKEPRSRGSEVRVLGYLHYDAGKKALDRFDVLGIGEAWGNKMNYTRREVRIDAYPWMYGIACELVSGDDPEDLIPPYNLLHYGSAGPYFPKK